MSQCWAFATLFCQIFHAKDHKADTTNVETETVKIMQYDFKENVFV